MLPCEMRGLIATVGRISKQIRGLGRIFEAPLQALRPSGIPKSIQRLGTLCWGMI